MGSPLTSLSQNGLIQPMSLPYFRKTYGEDIHKYINITGFSIENSRMWTNGPTATMAFVLDCQSNEKIILTFDLQAFVHAPQVKEQIVTVEINKNIVKAWVFTNMNITTKALMLESPHAGEVITINFSIPNCRSPQEVNVNNDSRKLGIAITEINIFKIDENSRFAGNLDYYERNVGLESKKSFIQKLRSGFWDRFVTGQNVLDIGFKGGGPDTAEIVPIVEGAIGVDLGYPGYNGIILPFESNSQDTVYSSHCLEHIPHFVKNIQEWYRVTKIGGHIITVVPSAFLYERRRTPPSRWPNGHERFYTPSSLLLEFERSLLPNSYRVRHLVENDYRYNYQKPTDEHPYGCYEIELVIQKIELPSWRLDD